MDKKYRKFLMFPDDWLWVQALIGDCPRNAYYGRMLPPKWCIFWFAVSARFYLWALPAVQDC